MTSLKWRSAGLMRFQKAFLDLLKHPNAIDDRKGLVSVLA